MRIDPGFTWIETERLRVRRFAPADAVAFAGYRADPDVARYQSWEVYSMDDAERFIREIAGVSPGTPGEWFQFAVADGPSDLLVGDVALRVTEEDPRRAELGFTFAPERQGHGYATEAVRAVIAYARDRLAVTTVFAITDARNAASIALLDRIGMRRVGTARARFKDEWCEEHTYETRAPDG